LKVHIGGYLRKEMKLLSTIFVIVMLGACASKMDTHATKQPTLNDYSLGEKWVWQFKGVADTGVVRVNGVDVREVVNDNGALSIKSSKGIVPIAEMIVPDLSTTPRYKWPLKVGDTWVYESHWTSEDGTKGKTVQDVEVVSYQEETVLAGEFMAYTISYKGNITNSRGYSAYTEEVILYSPEVKNFIKLTQKQEGYLYIEELAEYLKP